jgi:hypothetical protein
MRQASGPDGISATVLKQSRSRAGREANCLNWVTIKHCIGCGSDQLQRNGPYDTCGAMRGEDYK